MAPRERTRTESLGMLVPLPPFGGEAKQLGAGAEGHVEDAGYGQDDIVAEGIGADALVGDGIPADLEGRGGVVGLVVLEEEGRGRGPAGRGVSKAREGIRFMSRSDVS